MSQYDVVYEPGKEVRHYCRNTLPGVWAFKKPFNTVVACPDCGKQWVFRGPGLMDGRRFGRLRWYHWVTHYRISKSRGA